jgi:tetratricopeptide (TPR) repeat protein
MTSWDEIRGKIKHAHDKIESAYKEYVEPGVGKVKERPILNTAVKMSLSLIPIIGPNLRDLYDNIGGGTKLEEEDKAKQILEFLGKLEQQNKEQFDRIVEDLKSNSQAIIGAISENKIAITDLISKSSVEISREIGSVKEDTKVIRTILEEGRSTSSQLRGLPKPSTFRGESKIFVGRKQDIETIRNYFVESNLPVSITGEGGIGKSELAYKAMHKCEDMFDLIIPIYFGSFLTFESFLLEMAKSLNLSIDEFERKGIEERRDDIINTLGQLFDHPLIYADNYETIAKVLRINDVSASVLAKDEEGKDNAKKINAFLESIPPNTAILLTSRERNNLDGERIVRLDGLSETEGRDLFIELARNHFPKGKEPSQEIKKALEEISKKAGGHPLSIELLARSYRGQGLPKIGEMLKHMGVGIINPKEESERLQSLESCFEYSFSRLPQIQRDLLHKLTLFNSPFPAAAIEKIFGFEDSFEILLDLYDHSLLRRIEFDEYAIGDGEGVDTSYPLYYFHPAIKNYLERKLKGKANGEELQDEYGDQFSLYYHELLRETYNAIGTKNHVLSLERFNSIWQGKDNDFDRAIRLAKDRRLASHISSYLGLVLYTVGRYIPALEYHNKALKIHQELNDKVWMAIDYRNIGAVLFRQGNYDQALQYHNKSLAIHKELNDKVWMAIDYNNIGAVLFRQGNYDQALEYHEKALHIQEEFDDRVRTARYLANKGLVLNSQGNYDQALEYEMKALEMHKELEDRVGVAIDYGNIGLILNSQGNYDQALGYHKEALKIHQELNDKVRMAGDYTNIGSVFLNLGNFDQALEYYNKALETDKELQNKAGIAENYTNIGFVLLETKNYKAAMDSFFKGLEILKELEQESGYKHPLIDTLQGYISRCREGRDEPSN